MDSVEQNSYLSAWEFEMAPDYTLFLYLNFSKARYSSAAKLCCIVFVQRLYASLSLCWELFLKR